MCNTELVVFRYQERKSLDLEVGFFLVPFVHLLGLMADSEGALPIM